MRFALLLFSLLAATAGAQSQQKVVGYLQYQRFPIIDQIELGELTHLCIAFANPNRHGQLHTEGISLRPVVERAQAQGVKVLISLAGGALEAEWAEAWALYMQPRYRPAFIQGIVDYVMANQLDGVDVDLEWKRVNHNYSGFLIELGEALRARGKLMTAAVPAKTRYKHLNDQALKSLDFLNIMAYDLTGPWAPAISGPHSPYELAVSSLNYWKDQGLSKDKLVLGLPLYGWDFSDRQRVRSVNFGVIVERNPAFAHLDQVGHLYFNGLVTIAAKTELAMEQAGGVMLWELGRDAFGYYSALKAVGRALRGEEAPPAVVAEVPETAPVEQRIEQRTAFTIAPAERQALRPARPSAELGETFGEEPLAMVALEDAHPLNVEAIPNPFQDKVTLINHERDLLELVLTDQHGRLLYQASLKPGASISWETGSFPDGVYTFSAVIDGQQASKQLFKRSTPKPVSGK